MFAAASVPLRFEVVVPVTGNDDPDWWGYYGDEDIRIADYDADPGDEPEPDPPNVETVDPSPYL